MFNLKKYDEKTSCTMATKWINMEATEIENYLRDETEMLDCIETFIAITSYSISPLLNQKDLVEKMEKQQEIGIKFINNVFENISDEAILEILENWKAKFFDNGLPGEIRYSSIKRHYLSGLPYQKISNRVRNLFVQIDNKLVIGANKLIEEFALSLRKSRFEALTARNLADFVVGFFDESNNDIILYNLSNDSKWKIPISEIVDYQYQPEEKKEQIKIYTKNREYPEIIFISDKSSACEEIRKIYRQIEDNFNNKDTDDESNTDRDRLIKSLKELFTLGIISESEYIEKRDKIRDKFQRL